MLDNVILWLVEVYNNSIVVSETETIEIAGMRDVTLVEEIEMTVVITAGAIGLTTFAAALYPRLRMSQNTDPSKRPKVPS